MFIFDLRYSIELVSAYLAIIAREDVIAGFRRKIGQQQPVLEFLASVAAAEGTRHDQQTEVSALIKSYKNRR